MAEQESKTKADEKPTYHRDRLIAEAGDFFDGKPGHVVEGALSVGRHKSKVNFTREEAQKAVDQFLDREVEMSYGEFTGVPGKDDQEGVG